MNVILIHILILVAAVLLTVVICSLYFTSKTRAKLDFMLDALEDGETNFHFTGGGFIGRRINPSLNRLKKLLDHKDEQHSLKERYLRERVETESWTKLIRVLTHEIMNTVTPIASLSDSLKTVENPDEIKAGLDTISNSSRSLIRFVESYRSLTRVAAPIRKAFDVRELVDEVMELVHPMLEKAGAVAVYETKSEDVYLYADRGQISQILVNLVKNAVQAGASQVRITAEIDKRDRVIINVENNGRAISPESREQIFVPFYTTKPDGTGIGLSLSRQIMRLHGGNLSLVRSDAKQTVFALEFS